MVISLNELSVKQKQYGDAAKQYHQVEQGIKIAADKENFIPLNQQFWDRFYAVDAENSTKAQITCPWFSTQYNREREKLFYWAMRLHKEFILSSKCCRMNFRNLLLLWREDSNGKEGKVKFDKRDCQASFSILMQTLWLLVPVISTTFASVGRFLGDIKEPGMIGTLIVDEAGQAPPQMAVGALYRARKAIIVGDPKQIEPVVTDELDLLKKSYHEEYYKPYLSKSNSVQQFADQLNPYGTYLTDETNLEVKEWVGCPLVVHRRCISPMYDISNAISYNGIMKQQTISPKEEKVATFCKKNSCWVEIIGNEVGNKNHFVPKQGDEVLKILATAFKKSKDPNLYIISPFTSVVWGIKKYLVDNIAKIGIGLEKNDMDKWSGVHVGTVHTFQGKEANEVIFLLGCDRSDKSKGAIRWVNTNIVNVAVSRAKYRLYVIGDSQAWKESTCISKMKAIVEGKE